MSKPNPTYYAIVTADVRYDNDLVPNAKLLFGEITALANASGVCTATNNYFANLYGVNRSTVSEWVSMLASKGYIDVTILTAGGGGRTISLPHRENLYTPSGKAETPPSGKAEDNNTSNNNIARTPEADLHPNTLKAYHLYLKFFILAPGDVVKITGMTGVIPDKALLADAMKRYRLTPKRVAALERRLKDAEPKMVFAAIVGYGRADWSNGNNDRRWKADLADFICRSYENIERGARLYEEQSSSSGGGDAWALL